LRRNSQPKLLREAPTPGHYVDPWIQEIILVPGSLQPFSRYGLTLMRRGPYALTVVTELPENPGLSVTNNIEGIATLLLSQHPLLFDVLPSELFVVEHYCTERSGRAAPNDRDELDFTLVQMQWSDAFGYHNPQWCPIVQHTTRQDPQAPSPNGWEGARMAFFAGQNVESDPSRTFLHSRRRTSFKP
jgi:hypothetical protein